MCCSIDYLTYFVGPPSGTAGIDADSSGNVVDERRFASDDGFYLGSSPAAMLTKPRLTTLH